MLMPYSREQRRSEGPRSHQRAEGSQVAQRRQAGDPSLRLKNGSAHDDSASFAYFKLRHYPRSGLFSGVQFMPFATSPNTSLCRGLNHEIFLPRICYCLRFIDAVLRSTGEFAETTKS